MSKLNDLTVKELKEELDALGIEYNQKAKKTELIEILESETVESVEVAEKAEPKQYLVIRDFKDLQDKGYVYIKDDLYPRKENKDVTEERIKELMSNKNKIGKPLIKEQD